MSYMVWFTQRWQEQTRGDVVMTVTTGETLGTPSQGLAARPVAVSAFTVSERAARRIFEIAKSQPDAPVLRISVEGGGCSGFQYKFALVPSGDAEDLVIEREGARVVIDPVSLEFLGGSEVDFVNDLMGASFKIKNPNATASCGCGTSFTV
jgi:iron-sulfur cluster assembly accessory protein